MERAGRLLKHVPGPTEEHGIHTFMRASFALNVRHDPAEACTVAVQALEIAREGGSVDGEMICLSLEGLAMVAQGEVDEGMRRLDEATAAALGGEVADARIVQLICCHMIDACKRVRDFDRADEWCGRVEEIASRYDDREMFALCRVQYGELLVWRGAWAEAEAALNAVCRDFAKVRRSAFDAVVRLAELRRRQGRVEEAASLVEQVREHRLAGIVRAGLALDRGDAAVSAEEAERYLRRIGETDRFERVPALELLVRAKLALGDLAAAERAAGSSRSPRQKPTPPRSGRPRWSRGVESPAPRGHRERSRHSTTPPTSSARVARASRRPRRGWSSRPRCGSTGARTRRRSRTRRRGASSPSSTCPWRAKASRRATGTA